VVLLFDGDEAGERAAERASVPCRGVARAGAVLPAVRILTAFSRAIPEALRVRRCGDPALEVVIRRPWRAGSH
jgi:hypothetical protein